MPLFFLGFIMSKKKQKFPLMHERFRLFSSYNRKSINHLYSELVFNKILLFIMVPNVCQLVAIQFQKISEFPIQQITISIPKLKHHKCKIMIVQT